MSSSQQPGEGSRRPSLREFVDAFLADSASDGGDGKTGHANVPSNMSSRERDELVMKAINKYADEAFPFPTDAPKTVETDDRLSEASEDLLKDPMLTSPSDSGASSTEATNDEQEANTPPSLLDRHNRAIAQILKRFANLTKAAMEPLPQGAVLEQASLNRMTMETESAALIAEVQNLLALSREIKSLWIQGPLRKPGENDARLAEIDQKAVTVSEQLDQVLDMFQKQTMAKVAKRKADKAAKEEPNPQQGLGGDNVKAEQ